MDHIAATDLKIGLANYMPGDRVDQERVVQLIGERTFEVLTRSEQIVPLTRERFSTSVVRRPSGAPWPPRGFTQAYLLERGIIDAPRAETVETVVRVELSEDRVAVGPYFYQGRKAGNFTYFDVIDETGLLLRAKGFKNSQDAQSFLEDLFTNPAGADTPEGALEGSDDDGDVHPGSV